jgi:hypothetical protein
VAPTARVELLPEVIEAGDAVAAELITGLEQVTVTVTVGELVDPQVELVTRTQ